MPLRSVYGLLNVPSRVLPYVLLIICQIIVPNASFFGHLSGILVSHAPAAEVKLGFGPV